MKTRQLIVVVIIVSIASVGITLPNVSLHQEDFAIFLCDSWFFSDSIKCTKLWEDPSCHQPGSGCIFPEKTPFEQFVEKKAIAAFNLKLDDYSIGSKVKTAYHAYTTGNHKALIAQAATVNGSDVTRYYLTTTFDPDESLDNIDVEIYKIISEKCNLSIISKGSGCESKYLETMEQPIRSSLDYGWQ